MKFAKTRAAHRAALLGCSALLSAAMATQAFAQTAADENATLTEIVVTAQKREQSVQDVPIAITAVSQEALQVNRITNVTDLSASVPNLAIRNTAGGTGIPVFAMRGVVGYGSVPGSDKSIGLYLDGVFLGSAYGSSFELPDLERIEVLRGPQGTLFGRNSTAGAVSIVTRNPSGQFGVRQELTYGNYEQFRSATRVEFPQWGPLSASLSYTHDERTGDIKNLGAGTVWNRTGPRTDQGVQVSPKTLGDKSADTVFAALRFEPSDNFSMVYKFDWTENHFTPEGTGLGAFTPELLGPNGVPLALAYAANPVAIAGGKRPKYVNNSYTTPGYLRVQGHNVTTNWRISDSLSLKNILAYRKSYTFANSDIGGAGGLVVTPAVAAALEAQAGFPPGSFAGLVGSPFVAAGSNAQGSAKQWSDEIQLNYDSKYLTLTTGALYFDQSAVTGAPDGLAGTSILTPVPGGVFTVGTRNLSYNYTKSAAAYVQAEVHVLPQLDLVGGYRITQDKKSGLAFVNAAPFAFEYKKTRPTYLAGVNYRPTDDILLYGKYSTGFVSGGSVSGVTFDPETVKAWEAGAKADMLDKRLRVNAAVYKASYKSLQAVIAGFNIGRPDLGTLIADQGDLKTKGFELEATALPMRGLTLGAGLGYTDVELTTTFPPFIASGNTNATLRPKWTANLSAQYETEPLFNEARLMFRADASWKDKVRTLGESVLPAAYEPIRFSDSSWLVNARVALRNITVSRGDIEVALWAKNLTDNDEPMFPINFTFLGSTSYQPARTFGIDVIYNY